MKRRDFNKYLAMFAVPGTAGLSSNAMAGTKWNLTADITEACSCSIPCPCNFGFPTDQKCEGSRLIQILSGEFNQIDLTGITFLATFEMGKWAHIYVDDKLNERQNKGFDLIFPVAFAGFKKLSRKIERVPMSYAKTSETIKYSVPDSTVEIKKLRGLEGAEINITGLPSTNYRNYIQYQSVIHTHKSSSSSWRHKETNGFTSRMIVSGTA